MREPFRCVPNAFKVHDSSFVGSEYRQIPGEDHVQGALRDGQDLQLVEIVTRGA